MKKLYPLFTPPLARLHNPTGAHERHRPAGEYSKSLRQCFALEPSIDRTTGTNTLLHLWRRLCIRLIAPAD